MFHVRHVPASRSSGGRKPGGVGTHRPGPAGAVIGRTASEPSVRARATTPAPIERPSASASRGRSRRTNSSKAAARSGYRYASTVAAAPATAARWCARRTRAASSIATLTNARPREARGGFVLWAAISASSRSTQRVTGSERAGAVAAAVAGSVSAAMINAIASRTVYGSRLKTKRRFGAGSPMTFSSVVFVPIRCWATSPRARR